MRAILLCAGRGVRFRPVTERIPKPLVPFLNVPLASAHLRRLHEAGVGEVAVNLHHLPDEIEGHLREPAPGLPQLAFFREPQILGTAGALRNAAEFLATDDFLVVNSDAALAADYAGLVAAHRASGRPATLLVVQNREPERYTPLQSKGDRITAFGVRGPDPLLYTGICVLGPGLLERIPAGERALVADLWQPLLDSGEEIGFVRHDGPFADLGRAGDFLRASLEALARGGTFPAGAGAFDRMRRVLHTADLPANVETAAAVIGDARVGSGASVVRSAVWSGCRVGDGARLDGCLLARGRVPAGAHYRESLLWADSPGGDVAVLPLDDDSRRAHGFQPLSPRR
ncbi:MAG TPA: NDP-sugar synthase [Thermoanaerobaculia bacterium]|jgi:mannose-1-phosphate guanylyltransferase|nr:NDP-sugar synthase [Thermoanaerobaculia bacterium]